jgi:hypothetical protein
VDSPAGEGELRHQLASALVELRRRHDTESRQQQWCGCAAWPRHQRLERKEALRQSTAAPFKAVTARGSNGGGPGLGSRHASEGMAWGPSPTGGWRWSAAGARAGGVPQHGAGEGLGH